MQDTVQKLRALARAQMVLARIEVRAKTTQVAMLAAALTLVLLGLGMLNLAAYLALSEAVGAAWSALILGIVDAVLAAIVVSAASRVRPSGPEIEGATEVRNIVLDSLTADAEEVKGQIAEARADVERIRSRISAFTGGLSSISSVVDLLTGALRGSKKKKS